MLALAKDAVASFRGGLDARRAELGAWEPSSLAPRLLRLTSDCRR
jgi:hypothetical protein